jgi:HK97 family phage portal protein
MRMPHGFRMGADGRAVRELEWPSRPSSPSTDVLGLPAFNRGKCLLAGIIGQMPIVDRQADGAPWPENPVMTDPWPVVAYPEWITYQVDALIMTGDAMALPADFDFDGYARQLVPIDPRAVQVYIAADSGAVLYDLYTDRGVVTLPRSAVWHARGMTLTTDALRGVGVPAQMAMALGGSLALQRYAYNAFTNSGVPSGIIKLGIRQPGQKQVEDIKADWMRLFADRSPAVIGQMIDFTPLDWSPLDALSADFQRLSVADIAFALNLDPTDLDTTLGSSMTYANREQRSYDRLLTSIGPIISRFEAAYRFFVPRGHRATFDRNVVLWSDAKTRSEVQQIQLGTGAMVLNEARAQEQRPLYDDWANVPFAQPPAPPPPPEADPLPPPSADSAPQPAPTLMPPANGNRRAPPGPVRVSAYNRQPPSAN